MEENPRAAKLRSQILELTQQYHAARWAPTPFRPGQDVVHYAGRVFDQTEVMALVDSSLDFWLTAGRFHVAFEQALANHTGNRHALMVNSGSSANLVALSALTSKLLGERRLVASSEVITTACGFPTTLNPILQNGCTPVVLDTEVGTYNIDCSRLEEAVSDKTRAVMVAHTLGNPFDLDKITAFCKKHDLLLIEDCCDALGAMWDGKKVGTFGDAATLSFYPAHHITTGEGGAVLTSKPLIKRAAESMRDWGRDRWCVPGTDNTCGKRFGWKLGDLPSGYDHKYTYSHIGYNLKATDMQAAVGLVQLAKSSEFVQKRRENHKWYMDAFDEYEKYFILPHHEIKAQPSPFGFVLTVREDAPFSKNQIVQYLESKKIQTRMVFAGNLLRQPAYAQSKVRKVGELSGADAIMERTFWIGVYPGLNEQMRDYVMDCVRGFVREKPGWKKN